MSRTRNSKISRRAFCAEVAATITVTATPSAIQTESQQGLKPLIKYRGGKSKELTQYLRFIPKDFQTYFEPFVGGGATFFAIAPQQAVIGDINEPLINFYRDVRNRFDDLKRELAEIQDIYERNQQDYKRRKKDCPDERIPNANETLYYQLRDQYNGIAEARYSRAALYFFINKTSYSGMIRFNAQGHFNVPFGRYLHPTICNAETIKADSELLNRVELVILNGDFERTIEHLSDGFNLFYFDPPYRPLNATSSFNSYSKEDFNDEEQIRLRDFCARLSEYPNVKWMLSNADCSAKNPDDTFFEEIYGDFNINRVYASRAINANPSKRGKLTELLIKNYE